MKLAGSALGAFLTTHGGRGAVLAGNPRGDLGIPIPDSDEFLLATTTDRDAIKGESLYIELRRAGKPVDPALWFNLAMQGTEG